jgi:hypothetical protein
VEWWSEICTHVVEHECVVVCDARQTVDRLCAAVALLSGKLLPAGDSDIPGEVEGRHRLVVALCKPSDHALLASPRPRTQRRAQEVVATAVVRVVVALVIQPIPKQPRVVTAWSCLLLRQASALQHEGLVEHVHECIVHKARLVPRHEHAHGVAIQQPRRAHCRLCQAVGGLAGQQRRRPAANRVEVPTCQALSGRCCPSGTVAVAGECRKRIHADVELRVVGVEEPRTDLPLKHVRISGGAECASWTIAVYCDVRVGIFNVVDAHAQCPLETCTWAGQPPCATLLGEAAELLRLLSRCRRDNHRGHRAQHPGAEGRKKQPGRITLGGTAAAGPSDTTSRAANKAASQPYSVATGAWLYY